MKNFRELRWGIAAGFLSLIILIGAIFLSFYEGQINLILAPSPTATFSMAEVFPSPTQFIPTSTFEKITSIVQMPTKTSTKQQLMTLAPSQTIIPTVVTQVCTPPEGWIPISIGSGIILELISEVYNISIEDIIAANCLDSTDIGALDVLYVYAPTPTISIFQCGPPEGWITYKVKSGDNLFRIGLSYGVTVSELQFANCLGNSSLIITGQILYVPNVIPITIAPTPTRTKKPKKTPKVKHPTPTPTQAITYTSTPSPTPTQAITYTSTPSLTLTATPISTTPTPTLTFTETPTFTPSATPTITIEPTPTAIELNTPTP
ncbi:MAG: LysM peptidoglycan-binding domain-containing protein [Anaerolineales bacterium]|nr:LysM peptidoglycan-binding domain-containing protein [Anaerolineales bacterium]